MWVSWEITGLPISETSDVNPKPVTSAHAGRHNSCMFRVMGLGLCLLLAGAQDPADRVRALVEKLKSDEIAEREAAARELVKLGPPGLPALRDHVGKSAGEVKTVLQSIIGRIESSARLDKLLGSAPTVTLDVRDAEIEKVVADMSRQTGLDISGFFLDASMRVTLKCDGIPVWKAVEDLCRAHGGLGARYGPRSIVVEAGLHPGTAVTIHRSLGVHFRPARRAAEGKLHLQGVLMHPSALPVWSTDLQIDEITDDLGTSLASPEPKPEFSLESILGGQGRQDQFTIKLIHRSSADLPEKAARLKRVRGAVVAQVAVEFATLFKVPPPRMDEETSVEEAGFKLTITARKAENKTRFRLKVLDRPDDEKETPFGMFSADSKRTLGWRDDRGEIHLVRAKPLLLVDPGLSEVEVTVPKGRELVTLEILEARDFTELRIPFDYANVPIADKNW